jgi:hypothetical protein
MTKQNDTGQHRRFIETARDLECDEDKERFEEKLGKIAKARPTDALTSAPKRSSKRRNTEKTG